MAKAVLGLHQLSITDKIQKIRQIITKLTGNAAFPTPTPALASVTTAVDKLETDYNDAQGKRQTAQAATNIQNQSETAVDKLMAALAGYVDSVAQGDDAKIMSAGLDTKAASVKLGKPSQAQSLSATAGDMDGEVDLNWQPMKGAASYVVESSTTGNVANPADWKSAWTGTKSKATIDKLTSGTRYWFRVAAIGSAGQGPWSDPATAFAS